MKNSNETKAKRARFREDLLTGLIAAAAALSFGVGIWAESEAKHWLETAVELAGAAAADETPTPHAIEPSAAGEHREHVQPLFETGRVEKQGCQEVCSAPDLQ